MSVPWIAAKILAGDLACVGHEVAAAIRSGADRVHVDVMELGAHDVTPVVCRTLKRVTHAPLEVHLLVTPAERLVAAFADAGVDLIAFHPEASDDAARTGAAVRSHGCDVGLALAAGTPLDVLDGIPGGVDLVLVTGATAGAAGEWLAPWAVRWLGGLRERLAAEGRGARISVDGGVDVANAAALLTAGADTLVIEAARCRPSDRVGTIAALKRGAGARRAPRAAGGRVEVGPHPVR